MKSVYFLVLLFSILFSEPISPPTSFKSIKLTQSPIAPNRDSSLFIGDSGRIKKGPTRVPIAGYGITITNDTISLYQPPVIVGLTNNHIVNYAGQTVAAVTVSWALTGATITSQTLTDAGSLSIGDRSHAFTSLSLVADKTYTLAITDGTSPSSASTYVLFYIQKFYGTTSDAVPTAGDIQAGTSQWAQWSAAGGRNLSSTTITGGGNYIFYAYPSAWGTVSLLDGATPITWNRTTVSVTNAYSHTENYYVYASPNTIVGTIHLTATGN